MNKSTLRTIIKEVVDRHFRVVYATLDEDNPFDNDHHCICDNKYQLQNDLVEALAVFFKGAIL